MYFEDLQLAQRGPRSLAGWAASRPCAGPWATRSTWMAGEPAGLDRGWKSRPGVQESWEPGQGNGLGQWGTAGGELPPDQTLL